MVLKGYFDMLEESLKEYLRINNVFDKSGCIFDSDDTAIPFNPQCIKMINKKGSKVSKTPIHVTSGNKSQLTAMVSTCAAGYFIPPMIIDRKRFINS